MTKTHIRIEKSATNCEGLGVVLSGVHAHITFLALYSFLYFYQIIFYKIHTYTPYLQVVVYSGKGYLYISKYTTKCQFIHQDDVD